ncbi:hemerythrin domain-containing protein [Uliginosibacterium sp. sgz301328]|uniref:hemerythrin domain-containing protein n=1 Tax=Uliginosibacterium sp. sgz301328 TaxID=3243764 RepID=UPI00359E3240
MRKLSLRLKHLSQEHRAAMMLVAAAREAAPEGAEDGSNLPGFARRVYEVFETEMEPHFQEEERHALPQLRAIGRDDLADKVLEQHTELRRLIAALNQPDAETIAAFSKLLQEHVDFEENVVWEALEAATPAELNS